MDKISVQRILSAHPEVRDEAMLILKECDQKLNGRAKVRFTQVLRSFKEQDDLYALGRTVVNSNGKSASRPMGYKVTNAKGGDSIHNYGFAIDFCLMIDNKEASWDDVKDFDDDGVADWKEVVNIFKKYGWSWGGDWSSFIDKPHFEKTFGMSLKTIKSLHSKKSFISGTSYIIVNKDTVNQKQVTTALNLRSCAGTDKPVLLVIPSGAYVILFNSFGDWSEVSYNNVKGFVSNKYLK